VIAGADAGDPGADDQHVEVLALHRSVGGLPRNAPGTPPRERP
jgi:hypothetical protein